MLRDELIRIGLDSGWAAFIDIALGSAIAAIFGVSWILIGIWMERKMASRLQDRIGPNRVGPFGLFQNLADMIKLMIKEIVIPKNADRPVFLIAPALAVGSVLAIGASIPFSPVVIGADINIGVLYIFAVSSVGIIAVLLAGWGSNNKYALLGSFRSVAMLISYEVPMILALMVPVLLTGTMSSQGIVENQNVAFLFVVPVSAILFYLSAHAEAGRGPFDLLEAESELVSGYHVEYSGMAFAMFMAFEFIHGFYICLLFTFLFLGGWQGPGAEQFPLLGLIYFFAKSLLVYFFQMWFRLTVPRIRIDQMLDLNWKVLVPLALVNLTVIAFLLLIIPQPDYASARAIAEGSFTGVSAGLYRLIGADTIAELPRAGVLLLANIVMVLVMAWVLRRIGRRSRADVKALVEETDYGSAPQADAPATAR